MKKFLVVSLMLILLGGIVAAQDIGVSAEVNGKFNIVDYKAESKHPDADATKGYRGALAGTVPMDGTLTFKAADDAAGLDIVFDLGYFFRLEEHGVEGLWADNNQASAWFKPLKSDLLTIRAGAKPSDATLRYGNLSSMPDNIISDYGRVIVEGYINAIGATEAEPYGLIFTTAPIQGLFIGLGWNAGPIAEDQGVLGRAPRIGDAYLGLTIGAGYEISGIGAVRAQYYGPNPLSFVYDMDKWTEHGYNSLWNVLYPDMENGLPDFQEEAKHNSIQAGFKLTALESIGLGLDVVAQIPLGVKIEVSNPPADSGIEPIGPTTLGAPISIGVVAAFATGNISVNGGVGLLLPYTKYTVDGGDDVKAKGIGLLFSAEPAIKIGDSLAVGADLALKFDEKQVADSDAKVDAPMGLGLGAFVKYTVGKGTLKTGIAVTIDNLNKAKAGKDVDTYSQMGFKIPLTLTVGF
jgi:hypothetical protein